MNKTAVLVVKWTKLYLSRIGVYLQVFKKRNFASYCLKSTIWLNTIWNGWKPKWQRPGPKCIRSSEICFPNLTYGHPSKLYLTKEQRAFSHGCIRVAVQRFSNQSLEWSNWTVEKNACNESRSRKLIISKLEYQYTWLFHCLVWSRGKSILWRYLRTRPACLQYYSDL
jgi:hypothetical protein